jgi:predicted NAD-dependent protein-ADP-ribosyltransferase YbiA (DUF1768 family)
MRQYSSDEIYELLQAKGGDTEDQVAAMVVVTQSIMESRRLGRIAVRKPKNRWNIAPDSLRGSLTPGWNSRHNN